MADEEKPPQLKDENSAPDEGTGTQANADAEAKEAAQKALEESKELLNKGMAGFKSLDLFGQIYLAGLAVFVIFGAVFTATTGDITWEGSTSPYHAEQLQKIESTYDELAPSILGMGWVGKLAFVGALGGIGLFIWNLLAKKKEVWAPLALIGAAGLVVLLMLFIMMVAGSSIPQSTILGSSETFDVDMTLLGFWLPLAGAVAATVVAVKKVMGA